MKKLRLDEISSSGLERREKKIVYLLLIFRLLSLEEFPTADTGAPIY